jgi:hypothetical protein
MPPVFGIPSQNEGAFSASSVALFFGRNTTSRRSRVDQKNAAGISSGGVTAASAAEGRHGKSQNTSG